MAVSYAFTAYQKDFLRSKSHIQQTMDTIEQPKLWHRRCGRYKFIIKLDLYSCVYPVPCHCTMDRQQKVQPTWMQGPAPQVEKEATPKEIAKVVSRIHKLYDKDVPFYDRDSIKDLATQVEKANPGDVVYVKDLNGKQVTFRIETGNVVPGGKFGVDKVVVQPVITFKPLQELLEPNRWHLREAFCSIEVNHRLERWNKTKGAMIPRHVEPYKAVDPFFKGIKHEWDSSKACRDFQEILNKRFHGQLTKIVAFALGWMSYDVDYPTAKNSAMQHAALITLRDFEADEKGLPCFSQEPSYSDVDKAILKKRGITPIENPHGFLEVDEHTAVVCLGADAPIHQIVADITKPAVILWDKQPENSDG